MRNDRQAITELEANGPPPYDSISKATVHTKWSNRYEPGQLSGWRLISAVLFDSNASLNDLRDYMRGLTTSQDHFRDAVEREDVPSLGTTFAMPFFVFQGAVDNVTPVAPVREYVNSITAPQKELVLIPNAGHNAIATRSDEFLKLLLERVRPLAPRQDDRASHVVRRTLPAGYASTRDVVPGARAAAAWVRWLLLASKRRRRVE